MIGMKEKIWACKIGGPSDALPNGSDMPMRKAVSVAYREITGHDPEFIFSGWAGDLTEPERAVVENREPSEEYRAQWIASRPSPAVEEALAISPVAQPVSELTLSDFKTENGKCLGCGAPAPYPPAHICTKPDGSPMYRHGGSKPVAQVEPVAAITNPQTGVCVSNSADALYTTPPTYAQGVAAGRDTVSVPKEPTEAMIVSTWDTLKHYGDWRATAAEVYKAMCAAAKGEQT